MNNQIRISVIVPHYNDNERCVKLVDEMLRQHENWPYFELIVVDNGSDVPLSLPEHPALQLLLCSTPGSYAARNLGVQHAKGEILAFTDSDCMPDKSWLPTIKNFFAKEQNTNKLLAGRVQMFPAQKGRENLYEAYDCLLGLDQENFVKRGYAITANLVFLRKVYDTVGGFDSARLSGGDAAFVRAAVRLGSELVYVKEAVVHHPARNSFKAYDKKNRRTIGGQIRCGSLKSRMLFTIRNLFPPVVEVVKVLRKESEFKLKAKVFGFLVLLWYMRAKNTLHAWLFLSYMAR